MTETAQPSADRSAIAAPTGALPAALAQPAASPQPSAPDPSWPTPPAEVVHATPAGPIDLADVQSEAAERPAAAKDDVGRFLKWSTTTVVWGLSIIATYVASYGQVEHAEKEGVKDHLKYLFPAALELTAIAFMMLGYIQARRGKSPWPLWACSAGFGAYAVYLQLGQTGGKGQLFAGASVAALALWFAKLTGDYKSYRAAKGQRGLGSLWVYNTRLAFRATLVHATLRDHVTNTAHSIELAMTWIATFDDCKIDPRDETKTMPRRLRRRHAWRTTARDAGMPIRELPKATTLERVGMSAAPAVGASLPPAPAAGGESKPAQSQPPAEPQAAIERPVARRAITGGAPSRTAAARVPQTRVLNAPVNGAPVSPAPAGSGDPYLAHAAAINAVKDLIPDWETRTDMIKASDVLAATTIAANEGRMGKPVTGKPTQLKISYLVDSLSHRRSQITEQQWATHLANVDRETVPTN